MIEGVPFSTRLSRRAAWSALAAFAALISIAQIPPSEDEEEWGVVLRGSALPSGEELMAQVRHRLPPEPLDLVARVITRGGGKGEDRELRAEASLRFGDSPPSATYSLMNAFGVVKEELRLRWMGGGLPEYRVRRGEDLQEVPGVDVAALIEGMDFAWSDFSLAFLWWPGAQTIKRTSTKMRSCYLVEIPAPAGSSGVAKARLWIDRKETFVLRAQFLDAEEDLLREVEADSIEQIGDIWMVKDLEIKTRPVRRKTRIVVDEVRRLAPAAVPTKEENSDAEDQ